MAVQPAHVSQQGPVLVVCGLHQAQQVLLHAGKRRPSQLLAIVRRHRSRAGAPLSLAESSGHHGTPTNRISAAVERPEGHTVLQEPVGPNGRAPALQLPFLEQGRHHSSLDVIRLPAMLVMSSLPQDALRYGLECGVAALQEQDHALRHAPVVSIQAITEAFDGLKLVGEAPHAGVEEPKDILEMHLDGHTGLHGGSGYDDISLGCSQGSVAHQPVAEGVIRDGAGLPGDELDASGDEGDDIGRHTTLREMLEERSPQEEDDGVAELGIVAGDEDGGEVLHKQTVFNHQPVEVQLQDRGGKNSTPESWSRTPAVSGQGHHEGK